MRLQRADTDSKTFRQFSLGGPSNIFFHVWTNLLLNDNAFTFAQGLYNHYLIFTDPGEVEREQILSPLYR